MSLQENLKKLKLVVFDLDGTLLNNRGEICPETIELVGRLRKMGMRFSFASGRLHSTMVYYAKQLEIETPIVSLDGCMIKDFNTGQVFYDSFVPEKYVLRAIKLADEKLLKVALCHDESIYFTEYDSAIPSLVDKFGADFREVQSLENFLNTTLEVVLIGDYKDSIKEVEKKFDFPYAFGLKTNFYKTKHSGKFYYLELRKKGNSKGTGLKKLMKICKVKKSHTGVIGDWYNDREMLENAGVKAAVANAVPEISRIADIVTKNTNDEAGAAEFLEMILKAKEK